MYRNTWTYATVLTQAPKVDTIVADTIPLEMERVVVCLD